MEALSGDSKWTPEKLYKAAASMKQKYGTKIIHTHMPLLYVSFEENLAMKILDNYSFILGKLYIYILFLSLASYNKIVGP